MNRTKGAVALLLVWLAVLVAAGLYVQHELVIGTDLRLFLPSARTAEQRLLLEEIGEGPASRLLVIALSGAQPELLADLSRQFVTALNEDQDSTSQFRLVANGEVTLDAIPEELLAYRYLLSSTLDDTSFDARFLHEQLLARARDLASPAGALLEPLLPSDPTLETLKLAEHWQPAQEPNRQFDVWFDSAGARALILAETVAPAFDPDRQRAAIDTLRGTFQSLDPAEPAHLTISGPGAFAVLMETRTRTEAQTLGAAATIGIIILMLAAYRKAGFLLLSALPLASAGIAGLLAVSLLFPEVHGITLAFGFTLIGVAQDYPAHLLSHQQPNRTPLQIVRELWPTLATGVASTCIAYATFFFSGVAGLMQLACFTVTALVVAGAATRWVLPRLIATSERQYGQSAMLDRLWSRATKIPKPRWAAPLLAAASITALMLAPGPMWENDLSKLTPVPSELLQEDQVLRQQLGTPDLRYLLVVQAGNTQLALARLGELDPRLQELLGSGAISNYDHAARYLPTSERQIERQRKLPDEATLRTALEEALRGTPFRQDAFQPFLKDIQRARTLKPLTLDTLLESPLGRSIEVLFSRHEDKVTALISLGGVQNPQALKELADSAGPEVLLLDLKRASESLVAQQRMHLLWSLAMAAVLLMAVVAAVLGSPSRTVRVLTPLTLTTLVLLAILHVSGVALNLFHLTAMMLAAGLGLDYALFFERGGDSSEQRRTLHAILVCAFSTLMVFALLATSSLPILRAIGVTVSLGVALNFLFALALARRGPGQKKAAELSYPDSDSGSSLKSQVASLATLIPHQGSMCLLERVITWNEQHIQLETASHRCADNPLRTAGRLRAIHLCEYGAQAMAVHGALRAQASGGRAPPGMLVSLRNVSLACEFIDQLPGVLQVMASCLQAGDGSQQYDFKVLHADEVLAEGRAAVVLSDSLHT